MSISHPTVLKAPALPDKKRPGPLIVYSANSLSVLLNTNKPLHMIPIMPTMAQEYFFLLLYITYFLTFRSFGLSTAPHHSQY